MNQSFILLTEEQLIILTRKILIQMREEFVQVVNTEWINEVEAMKLLHIRSRTTLQKLRDTGKIRFTQFSRKSILYHRKSIMDFLDSYRIDPFDSKKL